MMDESTLVSALRRDIDSSTGKAFDLLNASRAKALKYYLGEPYGNEVQGRSKVVTTEVADTIESMLPSLLKPFISSERVVYFDPVGPEDDQAAKQETDYVNHVFYKENDGLSVLYTWFKDALLSKNGIVKYYWEEVEKVTTESYTRLTDQELMALLAQDGVEIEEQDVVMDTVMGEMGPEVVTTYDIKVKRTEMDGRVRVDNIPPEQFLIDATYTKLTLQEAPFCAHETETTLSDLAAKGHDISVIKAYAGRGDEDFGDIEENERFRDISSNGGRFARDDGSPADPSMRRVKLTECYKRVDYDGDGYAELRRILLVNDTHILENDEIDYVPFEVITPVPMTHRFFGQSAADQSMDIQLQKSTLVRNVLDNLYLINNVRSAVVDGEVNIGDLMDSTPGGMVRMTAPGMVQPLPVQPFSGHAFGMLEYLDNIKENRTGVTRYNQGIDADSLNKTATGISRIMDASAQRLELVARLFGEGVKRLMLGIHRLILQNQDKEKVVQLRGQWVPVNPNEWKDRTNMTVIVGLGTENKDKMLGHLMMILNLQKEALGAGLPLSNAANLYNTAVKIVENAGLKNPELFFTDPATVEPTPPEPSAEEKMVIAQAQAAAQDSQIKMQTAKWDHDEAMQKLAIDAEEASIKRGHLELQIAIAQNKTMDETLDRVTDSLSEGLKTINGGGDSDE